MLNYRVIVGSYTAFFQKKIRSTTTYFQSRLMNVAYKHIDTIIPVSISNYKRPIFFIDCLKIMFSKVIINVATDKSERGET